MRQMKRALPLSFALGVALTAGPGLAQQLELPRLSPAAKVSQTVGLTEISVEYSSPAVRGRKIWGGLVPYGEVWRAGANTATKVTFSQGVTVGGTAVPPGAYALMVLPQAKGPWTVILNKEVNQWGSFSYKKEHDLLRIDVTPKPIAGREHLAFIFGDFSNQGATLDLEWEKVRLSIPIKLDTDAQVAANIKAYTEGAWNPYNTAARYMLEQKKDYDAGLELVERSIGIKETWFNVWTKAQLLQAKGRVQEAYPLAQRAQALGEKVPNFFYAAEVKKALAEWKR